MVDRKLIFAGVGTTAALAFCASVGWQLWQGRDGSSENPLNPTNVPVLPTEENLNNLQNNATPTSEPVNNVGQNKTQEGYTGPCWSLPGADGTRMSVEIGQASKYLGAVCIGVDSDGATHWWYRGRESITYPFAPESPTAIP